MSRYVHSKKETKRERERERKKDVYKNYIHVIRSTLELSTEFQIGYERCVFICTNCTYTYKINDQLLFIFIFYIQRAFSYNLFVQTVDTYTYKINDQLLLIFIFYIQRAFSYNNFFLCPHLLSPSSQTFSFIFTQQFFHKITNSFIYFNHTSIICSGICTTN